MLFLEILDQFYEGEFRVFIQLKILHLVYSSEFDLKTAAERKLS